jgi:fucose permease
VELLWLEGCLLLVLVELRQAKYQQVQQEQQQQQQQQQQEEEPRVSGRRFMLV